MVRPFGPHDTFVDRLRKGKPIIVHGDGASLWVVTHSDDFARGFAEDHDLDMAKYDADVNAAEIREEILKGIGTAFSNEIRATFCST